LYPKPIVPDKANWYNRKGLRMIGVGPKVSAVIGKVAPGSNAAAKGLQAGDVIAQVNGRTIFDAADIYKAADETPGHPVTLTIQRTVDENTVKTLTVDFQPATVRVADVPQPGLLARLLGAKADSPAALAGLRKKDVITALDGQPVTTVTKLIKDISSKDGTPVTLHLRRAESELDLTVTPQMAVLEDGEKRAMIGFLPTQNDGMELLPMGKYRTVKPSPLEQIRGGVMSIVNTLDAVLSRKSSVSVQHMGGPVMMMNAYYTILSGPEGIRMALWFSVVLNVNLALLNMLPIPVLDGGHITLAIIEAVRRKPVNVRILEFVQTACALTIIGFMVFIAFFDVQDLPFVNGKHTGAQFKKAAPAAEAQK
jgi:regulator of sigma E protease